MQYLDVMGLSNLRYRPVGELSTGTRRMVEIKTRDFKSNARIALSDAQLQRALAGEPPSAIALILSCLDPAVAAAELKSLPQEQRAV